MKILRILIVIFFLIGVGFVVVRRNTVPEPPKELPVLGIAYDFILKDSSEQIFDSHTLLGKVWVADFFFTTCGSICPTMTTNMAKLHRGFKLEEDVHLVSITAHPEYDTPKVLTDYAKSYNADTSKWHFLTGNRVDIHRIAVESFRIGDTSEPIFHSAMFVLIDREGYIRGYYDGTVNKNINELFKDIAFLLKNQKS